MNEQKKKRVTFQERMEELAEAVRELKLAVVATGPFQLMSRFFSRHLSSSKTTGGGKSMNEQRERVKPPELPEAKREDDVFSRESVAELADALGEFKRTGDLPDVFLRIARRLRRHTAAWWILNEHEIRDWRARERTTSTTQAQSEEKKQ